MSSSKRTVPHGFPALILVATVTACATSAAGRRAIAISDADREAKRALAMEATIDVAKIPARAFSVLPFTVTTNDALLQPLSYAITDFLTADLSRSPQLLLVERVRMTAILRELSLVDMGIADPRTAPRVGRLVGARRVLIGAISTGPNNDIVITARVVDVIAGTVEQLLSASAPVARVIDAEKALALRVFEELGIVLTPAQRVSVEQRQTTNLAATVAYGRGVESEARGNSVDAAIAFEEAVRLDAAFTVARLHLAPAPSASQKSVGAQRVLALSAQAINAAVPNKLPEAAEVSVQSAILSLLITIRVF